MNKNRTKSPFPWTSVSVLLFTAALLTASVIIYSGGQKERILRDAVTEMDAVANLKSVQVAEWKRERLNDATLIHENVTLVEHIDDMFIRDDPRREKSRLIQLLTTLIDNYDFRGAVLVDAGGKPGIAVPESEAVMGGKPAQQHHQSHLQPRHLYLGFPYCHGGQLPSP